MPKPTVCGWFVLSTDFAACTPATVADSIVGQVLGSEVMTSLEPAIVEQRGNIGDHLARLDTGDGFQIIGHHQYVASRLLAS